MKTLFEDLEKLHSQFPELQEANVGTFMKGAASSLGTGIANAAEKIPVLGKGIAAARQAYQAGKAAVQDKKATQTNLQTPQQQPESQGDDLQSQFSQQTSTETGFEDIEQYSVNSEKVVTSILGALQKFATPRQKKEQPTQITSTQENPPQSSTQSTTTQESKKSKEALLREAEEEIVRDLEQMTGVEQEIPPPADEDITEPSVETMPSNFQSSNWTPEEQQIEDLFTRYYPQMGTAKAVLQISQDLEIPYATAHAYVTHYLSKFESNTSIMSRIVESSEYKELISLYEAIDPNVTKLRAIISNQLGGKTAQDLNNSKGLELLQKIVLAAEKNGIKIPGLPENASEQIGYAIKQNAAQEQQQQQQSAATQAQPGTTGAVVPLTTKSLRVALRDKPEAAEEFVQTLSRTPKNGPIGQAVASLMQQVAPSATSKKE